MEKEDGQGLEWILNGEALAMKDLSALHDQGCLSHLDYYLALSLSRTYPKASPFALLSAALASRAISFGHICLDLEQLAKAPLIFEAGAGRIRIQMPDLTAWVAALKTSGFTGVEEARREGCGWASAFPLILDRDNHLYLSRYFDFQERVIRNLFSRVRKEANGPDPDFIEEVLALAFADQDPEQTAGQQTAVRQALSRDFLLISGGPGTGKTHVTGLIISLMETWAKKNGAPSLRVISMAPTGKAAARLSRGATIHSVLRPKPSGKGFFHDRDHPIVADLVIVDEASMIDMALMARLLEAVPMDAKLIFLGDQNQLSPVQAGAVFTDLCTLPALKDHRAVLSFNFRSGGKSGIRRLARAVNDQDTEEVVEVLTSGAYPDLGFINTGNNSLDQEILKKQLLEGYEELALAASQEAALDALDRFRVLCAHNPGDAGTLQVNHLCEKVLRLQGSDDITAPFFKGIVMVTRNDYTKGLFNGDTGVLLRGDNGHFVCFRDADKGMRRFWPAQMPDYEAAFAMTIHKAQGSEFDRILILIPDRVSPVMTRQLLYTGITRARSEAVIAGSLDIICQAVKAGLARRSNLAGRLNALLRITPKEKENH